MTMLPDGWEMVIGLEVHTELRTATKLFCGCANVFGDEPNTNICPVCLGLPGSMPVLNERAVQLAMAIGVALHCDIKRSTFHRKNYFYPDMPKDYQVSQYDQPINVNGHLDLPDGSRVRIERAHIEEDTGKTTHLGSTGRIHGADRSLVDYNRSGVPLVEIVSAPDMSTPEQARLYASELRGILIASGASDGRMEEGSMRVDANVSVRRIGGPLGTRCEIKNLNSLRSVARAIEHEALRQVELLEGGGTVRQETRHWDEDSARTSTLRSKEEAEDYRYFLEPDLTELAPSPEWVTSVREALGPMPAERRLTMADWLGTPTSAQRDAISVVVDLGLDHYVAAVRESGGDVAVAISRVANELAAADGPLDQLTDTAFAATVALESSGQLSATQAKAVLGELIQSGGDPASIAAARGFEQLSTDSLSNTIDELIATHADEWSRYRDGDDKLAQFFIGQVMKITKGQANGKAVVAELQRRR